MRARVSTTVLAVAVVLGLGAGSAGAEHSWNGYHFSRSTDVFALSLVDSMTPAWDPILGLVAADWSVPATIDAQVAGGDDGNGTRKKCAAASGAVRVCNADYGFNGWLGIAEIWVSGGHIAKARARLNDSYFSHPAYDDANARRHVACQEVGHTLGLGHQDDVSCMDDHNGLFEPTYVSPNAHDYELLDEIYLHLDPAPEPSGGKPGNGRGNGNGNDRNVSVERDGAFTKVTFVFPAHRGPVD